MNGSTSTTWGSTRYVGSGGGPPFSRIAASAVIITTSTSDYISAWCYHDAGNDRLWQGGESSFSGFRLS